MSTRRKIAGFLVLGVVFLGFSVLLVNAQEKKESAPAPKKEPAAQATASQVAKDKAEKDRKFLEEKKKELNNTKWEITKGLYSDKTQQDSDALCFFENRVISEKAKENGYVPTNYSWKMQGDDAIIWETMQEQEKKGDVVFWRGVWYYSKNFMEGTFDKNFKDGTVESGFFYSKGYTKIKGLPSEMTEKTEVKEEVKAETPPGKK